jgi:hypothetical protein
MFNKEVLNNRFQNGCLAAIGTAPIVGLASYKVLEDLKLDRDMAKIAKFTILVSLVSGLIWSMFPASRRKPSETDESAVRDAFSPKMLITISEHIKDAEDAYIVKLHKDQKEQEKKSNGVAYLEARRDSSFPGYRKDDPLDKEPVREYSYGLRSSGYSNSNFRSNTLSGSESSVSITKVLLADDNDE